MDVTAGAVGVARDIPERASSEEQSWELQLNSRVAGGAVPVFCTGGSKVRVRLMSAMLKRLEKLMISMLVFALRVEAMPRKLFLVLDAGLLGMGKIKRELTMRHCLNQVQLRHLERGHWRKCLVVRNCSD